MISFLNAYLDSDYRLFSIHNGKVFVFEKGGKVHLSQIIKPLDDNNKNFIGINSLKEATDLFNDAISFYNNVVSYDFILTSQVTPQSRIKFYEYLKEANKTNINVNFSGLKKLREKL